MPENNGFPITDQDRQLIKNAEETISKGYKENWHSIGVGQC